ncbi:phage tail protein [Agrobacterium sp. Ap1]|uniref:phage tail tip fiber protein n=1 Tax=Agrobacterium sp. Ap1 TaxID=2815337 RepID=UPI001A8FC3BB|nr:phage tail protein [Agrobacterium sp. Ap1]MBO0142254.1 phage tail protein [Agrobacterium sp. Ap1]
MAIFTAIGTAIAGALFAGSALAATIIGSTLAFAAQIGMQYLNRAKKRKYTAVQSETQYGGDISVQAIFGIGKTKGQRLFYCKWDKGNKRNAEVFGLSNGWCDGLENYVYLFGEKKSLIAQAPRGGESARYFVQDYAELIEIRFYDGRPDQPVDQRLVDVTSALGQKWKATSVGAGICYVVVERLYSNSAFGTKGKPDIEFVLRGLREYDPRKDSTVAGGSGAQRLANSATWTHTVNPAVHRLNYQLGLKALVSGRTLIGEGKSMGQIDLATYFVAMNVCDEARSDGKKRYQCSLIVTGEDDHTEVLKEFDDAMAGYGLNRRGLSGVIPGAPQIPVMEITAKDIPSDRSKEIQFRKSAFDRYNHLSGQFLSIDAMWNPESLKPVYVNADIAADGRNRQTSNDFLQVTDPDIAQYLLNIRYRQNRKGGRATLPVSRSVGMRVQEGEWVTWRGRQWMISEWGMDPQLRITLTLTETGADIYDDDDIEPGPIVIPPTAPVNPSLLFTVQNFGVQVGLITGAAGYQIPVLEFTWTPPEDPTIVAVRFEYKIDGATEVFEDQTGGVEEGRYRTSKNVVSGKVYAARATITTVPDRLKQWTPWVSTNDPTGDFTSPYAGVIGFETLGDDLKDYQEWLGSGRREILDQLAEIALLVADQDLGNTMDRKQLREQITATRDGITASYMQEVTVLAAADRALALSVTQLEASVFDPLTGLPSVASAVTALSTQVSTINGQVTAVSDAVQDLDATVGRFAAAGRFRTTVEATPSGALARIGLSVSASDGGTTATAAMYLDAIAGGLSRVVFEASQFIVLAGGNLNNPFVVDGTAVRMNVADIGTVNAGIIQSPNGKMVINVNQGTIVISS